MINWIASADDPRLDPYRHVGDPRWIRDQGLFVAEGRLVVGRLLGLVRFRVRSILVNRAAHDAMLQLLSSAEPSVLVCDDPTLESITAAMATAQIPDDFRFSITNAPGENAYPIAGATWLLVYQQQKDATKGKKLVEFLKWAQKEGEKMAKDLDYAPLPEDLQQRVLKRIDEIKM